MHINFTDNALADAFCICVTEAADEASIDLPAIVSEELAEQIVRAAAAARFKGRSGEFLRLFAPTGSDSSRVVVLGVGKADALDPIAWRDAGARLVRELLTSGLKSVAIAGAADAQAAASIALGVRLGAFRYDRFRTNIPADKQPSVESVTILVDAGEVAAAKTADQRSAARAEGVNLARNLVAAPPNVLFPIAFADQMKALEESGLEVEILDEKELEALGMASMLAVASGSVHKPRLAVLRWRGDDKAAAPLVLVGKGLTFDAGGISIKPAANMDAMKGDMAGAAAVAGTMLTLARRKAKADVVGILGLVENMADGAAFRPGDILTSASGKTIEVLNTDAEGRLVLCDLLHYAEKRFGPNEIIDLATLTGAILVTLGHEFAGLFSNDDGLAGAITTAGQTAGERVWRLPLDKAYDKMIDSEIADMKNLGSGGAGSITAAQFLQRFVAEGTAWAHLDIAGTAFKDKRESPADPHWATGYGVQLLDQLVSDRLEKGL
jgi:leucyl aminopeptidase